MKEITILSGKGGTGKTSITAAIASIAENSVFCDNDVDAANLHLILQPEIIEEHKFASGWKAGIDSSKCTSCNACVNYCRFDAIHTNDKGRLFINPFQCEGCRLCERICPAEAISSEQNMNNHWFVSNTRFGSFVHASMAAGEENSGKLVTQIRKQAKEIALKQNADFIFNDGPPGIGCAAISSVTGTDIVIIIAEPSKTSMHDVSRLIELIESFKIKAYAVINKYDINRNISDELEQLFESKSIKLLARIAFDKEMVSAVSMGKTIVEYNPQSAIVKSIFKMWQDLRLMTNI